MEYVIKRVIIIVTIIALFTLSNVATAFDGSACPIGCWVDTKGNCFCPEPLEETPSPE